MIVSISAPPSFRPFINILRSGLEIKFGEGWMKINLQTSLSHTSYLAWTPPFKSSCLALPIRALVPSLLASEKGRGKVSKQRRLSGGEGPGSWEFTWVYNVFVDSNIIQGLSFHWLLNRSRVRKRHAVFVFLQAGWVIPNLGYDRRVKLLNIYRP